MMQGRFMQANINKKPSTFPLNEPSGLLERFACLAGLVLGRTWLEGCREGRLPGSRMTYAARLETSSLRLFGQIRCVELDSRGGVLLLAY